MATCKDCIHYEVCEIMSDQYGISKVPSSQCGLFKNTADVVEVARCKDCVYCRPDNGGKLYCHKKADIFVPIVDTDDYCSYGERREE